MITQSDINSLYAEAGKRMRKSIESEAGKIMGMDDARLAEYLKERKRKDDIDRCERKIDELESSLKWERACLESLKR